MTARIHIDVHGVAVNTGDLTGVTFPMDQIGELTFTADRNTVRFGDVARFVREFVDRYANQPEHDDVEVEPDWPTIRVTTWVGPTYKGVSTDYPMDGTRWTDPRKHAEMAGALTFESGGRVHMIPWHRIESVEFIGWGDTPAGVWHR